MIDGPEHYHRRSIRLKGHDYTSPGAYFITVRTHAGASLFGDIDEGKIELNDYGRVVREEWLRTASVRPDVILDEFVVMPNHLHSIVVITHTTVGATRRVAATGHGTPAGPAPGSIGAVIGQFKSLTAKRINELRDTPGTPVWQRNYYEHIVRSDEALQHIREYIRSNPLCWFTDRENPLRTGGDDFDRWLDAQGQLSPRRGSDAPPS